jgi:hypothetical protein
LQLQAKINVLSPLGLVYPGHTWLGLQAWPEALLDTPVGGRETELIQPLIHEAVPLHFETQLTTLGLLAAFAIALSHAAKFMHVFVAGQTS